jgi:hypothetical protein
MWALTTLATTWRVVCGHIVRQLVDLIPKIYDTQRIARIIGVDGETRYGQD